MSTRGVNLGRLVIKTLPEETPAVLVRTRSGECLTRAAAVVRLDITRSGTKRSL